MNRTLNHGQISTFDRKLWAPNVDFLKSRNMKLNGVYSAPFHDEQIDPDVLTWPKVVGSDENHFGGIPLGSDYVFRLIPDGRISTELDLDALLIRRESNKLLVVMHGALQREKYQLPRFEFKNTVKDFNGSVLFVSDPTLYTNNSLTLGWYIGTENDNVHEMVRLLVGAVATQLGATDLVLTGSSGGGFASLAIAHGISGSLALSFSPQTSVERYHASHRAKLVASAFPNWSEIPGKIEANAERFDLGALYASKPQLNEILYVQNTGDQFHAENHCVPFSSRRGLDFSRGLFSKRGISVDCVMLREGHNPPRPWTMIEYIDRAFVKVNSANG